MSLVSGSRLGPYEILSLLGAGGMAEVYRARDTRLDRIVAIKILPETLASDPQLRERFDREARTIFQLDYPHIGALYDVVEEAGSSYLVVLSAVEPTGFPKLWARAIDSFAARPVEGTDGALFPFWSPDGNAIAFFVQDTNRLRKVNLSGGPVQTICDNPPAARPARGGTWSRDDIVRMITDWES